MRLFFKYTLPGLFLLAVLAACQKEYESIDVIDDRAVSAYIQQNNLNVTEYENRRFYYQIVTPGTGPELDYSDQVPMILSIRSLDGKYASVDTFSSNNRYYNFLGYYNPEPLRLGVKEVLKRSSGAIRMIIPSRLAFGRNGVGNIPGNASLDIMIRVLDKNKMPEYEDYNIRQYLTANNLTGFTKTSSGLYYRIASAGSGSPITIDSTIVAEYTGRLLNGKVFDQTTAGNGATFRLNDPGLRQGWKEGIPLINEGGSIRLVMPSSLAYGLEGSGGTIPPFMPLDFDVKITEVKP